MTLRHRLNRILRRRDCACDECWQFETNARLGTDPRTWADRLLCRWDAKDAAIRKTNIDRVDAECKAARDYADLPTGIVWAGSEDGL